MKMIYLMMKKTSLKMMNQNLKEKLKDYAKIAHEQFDNAFTWRSCSAAS